MSVFTTMFASDALSTTVYMTTILPQEKHVRSEASPEMRMGSFKRKYPVLLLLHDEASSQRELLYNTNIERFATEYGIAVVIPEGMNGFYCDNFYRDGGDNECGATTNAIEASFSEMRFEQMIMKEVLPLVQNQFLPIEFAANNAYVAGIGMGGFGAMRLAFKYPEVFSKAFSINGYLDIEWMMKNCLGRKEQMDAIFGQALDKENNLVYMVREYTNKVGKKPQIAQYWAGDSWVAAMNENFATAAETYSPYVKKITSNESGWDYIEKTLKHILTSIRDDSTR